MSNDCQWVESKLEDFLSDRVDSDTRSGIESHLEGCDSCRQEIRGYAKVDDLVGAYFRRQVARAESAGPPAFRPVRLAGATAGLLVTALVVWLGFGAGQSGIQTPVEEATPSLSAVEDTVLKAEQSADPTLAKPAAEVPGDPGAAIPAPGASAAPPTAAARFYVMDAGGYFYTLADYAGSILIIGVFDQSASGADAFAEAYEAYRSRLNLRFVGVSLDPEIPMEAGSFPMALNRGSSLMDTAAGQFAIITPDGAIHARGSLADPSFMDVLAASFRELGSE